MTTVAIVRTAWAGTSGGAGLTQLAVEDVTHAAVTATQAQAATNAVRAFWDGIKGLVPNEVTWTVSPVVDIYDIDDGSLVASVTAAVPPAAVVGTGTGSYSMAGGLKANLNTGVIRFGRRVRGSIFIVPTETAAFSNLGTAASTAKTTINTAGATMIGALATGGMNLVVWSRPVPPDHPDYPRAGDVSIVSVVETNDKTAVLRGRRD